MNLFDILVLIYWVEVVKFCNWIKWRPENRWNHRFKIIFGLIFVRFLNISWKIYVQTKGLKLFYSFDEEWLKKRRKCEL